MVSRPALDLELGGVAWCLEAVGVKELARHFLLDRIERKFVLPASAVYTISEQVSSGLEEAAASPLEEPDGVLSVTLVEARQLVNRDNTLLGQGVSDPYATLQFSADNTTHRWELNFKNNILFLKGYKKKTRPNAY